MDQYQLIRKEVPGLPPSPGPELRWNLQPSPFSHPVAPQPALLSSYVRTISRERWRLILFALAGALIGLGLTLPKTPLYRARTSLDVQSLNENFMNLRAVDPSGASGNYSAESNLQTHMKLLQSEELIRRVTNHMEAESNASLPRRDLLSVVARRAGVAQTAGIPRATVIADTAQTVKVKPIGLTRLIEIDCQAADPAIAAEFCNTLAGTYRDQDLEIRAETAQQTNSWLTRQLSDVRMNLEAKESRLLAYARDNKILFNQETDSVNQEKLKQDQLELSRAQADRVTKQSANDLLNSANPDSLPPVLDSGPLKGYEEKLTDLMREKAELESALTPNHPKVQKVQAQIDQLQQSIAREKGNVLARIRNEYNAARAREQLLRQGYQQQEGVVAGEVAKQAQFKLLRQEVDSDRQIYEGLMQRVREAGLVSMMRTSPVRIVDRAQPATMPFSPSRVSSSGVGLVLGSILGLAFVFWSDRNAPRLRSPGDSKSRLQTRELGVIPSSRVDGMIGRDARLELVTLKNERSLLAESYRATMNSILFNTRDGGHSSVIAVSSPHSGEGKTSLTCNLGIAIAETKRRVVLIDGDLRRPRLHDVFDVINDFGLSDILADEIEVEKMPLDAVAQQSNVPRLSVIPCGTKSSLNISSLLHGEAFEKLLAVLKRTYQVILIDTPPLLHMSDARVIGRLADGMVLVFRSGMTSVEAAEEVEKTLLYDHVRVLGTVLNDFKPQSEGRYGYYKNYYGPRN